MLSLRRPEPDHIRAFAAAQSPLKFTYPDVGATGTTPPTNYTVDHTHKQIGQGATDFERAKAALTRWTQFRLGWVDPAQAKQPIEVGDVAVIIANTFGVWWMNACRVVYVVNDYRDEVARWGFAYGTLPGHAERGEERFLIEWNRQTDEVWYDILAFSQPRHPLARIGKPIARRFQKRFARDSVAAMKSAIRDPEIPHPVSSAG